MVIKRGAMNHVSEILVLPHKVEKSIAAKIVQLMQPDAVGNGSLIGLDYAKSHQATYCAYESSNPDILLAPVMVKGLYQAAHHCMADNRYWMTADGKMVLLNVNDVRMEAHGYWHRITGLKQIKPALPVITDYLFNLSFNCALDQWGGVKDVTQDLICSSGNNGHHLAAESQSGVMLLSPNLYSLNHWQMSGTIGYERHVLEADLACDQLIYWSQYCNGLRSYVPKIEGKYPFDSHVLTYLPLEVRSHYPAKANTREELILSLTNRPQKKIYLDPIAEYFVYLDGIISNGSIDARNYDAYQHALLNLLQTFQHFPVVNSQTEAVDTVLAFEILPDAITSCVQLICNDSLDLSRMIAAALATIKTVKDHLCVPSVKTVCSARSRSANDKSMLIKVS